MNGHAWTEALGDAFRRLVAMEDCVPWLAAWPERDVSRAMVWHKVSVTAGSLSLLAGTLDDSPFAAFFRRQEVLRLFRWDRLRVQVRDIAEEFGKAGIEFVPLKGPLWCWHTYPPGVARHLGDIDLLVRKEVREEAARLLRNLGYLAEAVTGDIADDLAERGELMFNFSDATLLSVPVELHWEPLPAPRFLRRLAVSTDDFFSDCSREVFEGCGLRVPSPEVRMAFLAMHGACQHQFKRFLPVLDMACLLRAEGASFNWSRFADIGNGWGAGIGIYFSLRLLDLFAGLNPRAQEFLHCLEERIPWRAKVVIHGIERRHVLGVSEAQGRWRRKLLRLVCSDRCSVGR